MFPAKTPRLVVMLAGMLMLVCTSLFAQTKPASTTQAATAPQSEKLSDQDIQMLRSNLRSQRRQVIAANMKLTDAQAEKFWPVYDQYISELVAINGKKYALIKQYVQENGVIPDTQAEGAIKDWIGVDQAVAELRLKYVPLFRSVLSPSEEARFYMVDRRIQLMIDLQLASALPMVEPQ